MYRGDPPFSNKKATGMEAAIFFSELSPPQFHPQARQKVPQKSRSSSDAAPGSLPLAYNFLARPQWQRLAEVAQLQLHIIFPEASITNTF
eukprot:CAMPEP_0178995814 /NCGR_PEP_ID=MMETSP0795-20121207/8016_1 /TAXON_ID=88552 /ORGANISM="Amoebophrya sp., Strain Ameob2" /LENGTH=89 /DNA_ID=CAMNT_0020688123 /DNA_START=410 /DNA_END=680 /DNA_ORIENTATION=-